jgi:decaprenyl-phosphate phosphoribosyltransferase
MSGSGQLGSLIRLLRPKQWVKNLLVLAAPIAARRMGDREVVAHSLAAMLAFCAAASANYVVNDLRDAENDRLHPRKRLRPIAARQVSPSLAGMIAVILVVLACGFAAYAGTGVAAILAAYLVTTTAYSFGLKRVTVVEMVIVASGFLLRGLAGAAASRVPVSPWFFVVLSAASILVVAAKRSSEIVTLDQAESAACPPAAPGDPAAGDPVAGRPVGSTRAVLASYSSQFLASVQTMSAAVALIGYCLWAFDSAEIVASSVVASTLFKVSVAPFATAILRFLQLGERGEAEAPEDLLRDPILFGCAIVWGISYGIGIFLR